MNSTTQNTPFTREKLAHITRTEPYSLYRTEFTETSEMVLYLHWHPEIEFFYLEKGELHFFIEDTCYHMHSGDAIFIPPNLLHKAFTVNNSTGIFYALVFSTDLIVPPSDSNHFQQYIQPLFHDNAPFCLHIKKNRSESWHTQLLHDLERIFHAPFFSASAANPNKISSDDFGFSAELLIEGMIRVIWNDLYRHHLASLYATRPSEHTNTQLQTVLQFIHAHYQEDISLDTLAKLAHVSDAQLCRTFKQFTGSTPFTYLKRYRILKSCEWLLNSNKKISEICGLCGFNNISYYNREFLKIMKVTPSVYRKNRESVT